MNKALIIGAGPAGIKLAWQLVRQKACLPVILEEKADLNIPAEHKKYWSELGMSIKEMGGEILLGHHVQTIYYVGNEICSVHAIDKQSGRLELFWCFYLFSSLPVQRLIPVLSYKGPVEAQKITSFQNLFLLPQRDPRRNINAVLNFFTASSIPGHPY
jgi:hypothetical protein